MDIDRFDALTKARSAGRDRRGLLGNFVAGALAAVCLELIPGFSTGTAAKRRKLRAFCSKLGGKCVINADCCGPGTRCKNVAAIHTCTCRSAWSPCGTFCCPAGQTCCAPAHCMDLQTDPGHCGACYNACGADETCVAGSCTA